MSEILLLTIFPLAMAYAAVSDLIFMRIPNTIPLLLLVGFLATSLSVGLSFGVFINNIGMASLTLLATFLLFAAGHMGGGDAKLIAATVLWFGADGTFDFILSSSILGGVLTLAIIYLRRSYLPFGLIRWPWFVRIYSGTDKIPYGIAIALGALSLYPTKFWMSLI